MYLLIILYYFKYIKIYFLYKNMQIQIKNQFYLFLLFLIKLIIIDTNDLQIQCFQKNEYNYYFNEFLYNQTHCLKDVTINNLIVFNSQKTVYKGCQNCTSKEILEGLKILSPDDTLNEIIYNNKSISRFGDGEFSLIFGYNIGFQKTNQIISNKLYNVLQSNEEGLLIGLPNTLNIEYLDNFKNISKNYWRKWIEHNKHKLMILNKNKTYYSSFITRFYNDYKDKSGVSIYIKKLKKIWDQKDILIIEGEKSRLGVGNNLFNNTKSILRIICPSINAFDVYDKIFNAAIKIDKNRLILIALGPTASVLAFDLYKTGYHVVDVGHVDIEYEWYLRNATTKIKIENKFVNEAKGGKDNIQDIKDKNYNNQIIEKILN